MKSSAQVVVIGGGVVGASVLYHLTKAGWRDVMLVERAELTAGSTWHAAGGMHTINGDPNVAKLQQYTIELYKEIEADLRPELRRPCHRRHHAGRHAGAHGLAEDGQGPRPLSRHGPRDDLGRRGGKALPADRQEVFRRRPLRPGRGPRRPLRRDARLCQVGPDRRRHDRAAVPRHRSRSSTRTARGT